MPSYCLLLVARPLQFVIRKFDHQQMRVSFGLSEVVHIGTHENPLEHSRGDFTRIDPRVIAGAKLCRMAERRRFPPPWSIDESDACFIVTDHGGQKLAYFYFEREAGRRSVAKLLTRDEAFLLAVNFAELPMVPRQILKDIPRPPNTASRDD